jgi:iron complex transport system ATP-binding protein
LGVSKAADGSVEVCGEDLHALKPAAASRLMSYVPQAHEKSFPYPVEHVVMMGRNAWNSGLGIPDPQDRGIAQQALAECGIAHLAERPYTTLSGGETQMVLLARALAQGTPLILMDEPTAHLDFKNEMVFLETVERLVKNRGVSILMATHALNQAFHLACAGVPTRVALLHEGKVTHEGPPRQVLSEQTLSEVFGIDALLLEREADERSYGRLVRQLVPQRTLRGP